MRELCMGEMSLVQGAGVNFNSPLTVGMFNSVADTFVVAKAVTTAFTAGYAIGTWLNNTFDLSTKIVDLISP